VSVPSFHSLYQVEDAIVITHPYPETFGHVVGEVLPTFLAIPTGIWARSVLFLCPRFLKAIAIELLQLCGKKPMMIRNMWKSVFARNLYVPRPWYFMHIWADAIRAMRQQVFRQLGLPRGRPETAVIEQRSRTRIIQNLDELWPRLRREFPLAKWFILTEKHRSIADQIFFHANVTLLALVSGSGGANAIWMQRNSAMIEIQVRHCVAVLSEMARAAGVKVFEIGGTNWRRVTVNISVLMSVIIQAFEFMKRNEPGD
jgi:hypothetical protein